MRPAVVAKILDATAHASDRDQNMSKSKLGETSTRPEETSENDSAINWTPRNPIWFTASSRVAIWRPNPAEGEFTNFNMRPARAGSLLMILARSSSDASSERVSSRIFNATPGGLGRRLDAFSR